MSGSNVSSYKFNDSLWKSIETVLPEIEIKRNKILSDLGNDIHNNNFDDNIKLTTIGNEYYVKIRVILEKHINLPKLVIDKKNDKKKVNSKNKIILENSYKVVEEVLNNVIKLISNNNISEMLYEDVIKSIDFIDFRILVLMCYIEYYTKQYKKVDERVLQEILLASKKILYNVKKNKNKFKKIFNLDNYEISFSEILINDFEYKIGELNKKCDFTLYEVANKYPKLIFDTRYDTTIPEIKLKPYDTQVQLINEIKNNFDNGFLINLRVLTGLGKTSSIVSVCKYINNLNNDNVKIIFCCSDLLDTVRIQVAKLMYNFNIKFGIGVGSLADDFCKIDNLMSNDENIKKNNDIFSMPSYKITTSYNCGKTTKSGSDILHQKKKLSMCDAIICDYITTYMLLKENEYEYVLFFDEPTIDIDNKIVAYYMSQILYYSPKRIILSSATLPLKDEITNYLEHYSHKYVDGNIIDISSNKVLVGCVIKDFNGNTITPHLKCSNRDELSRFILKIKNYPLLGKFYTLTYLINLNLFLKNYELHIDIEKIETFDQENILENILFLMEIVCNNMNIDYDDFIKIKCMDINENKINNKLLPEDYDIINHKKLLTNHAFKFLGCCLISVDDPEKYIKENFEEIVETLKSKLKINNVSEMYNTYTKTINDIDEEINKVETTMKEDKEGNKEEVIKKLNSKKPKFPFPSKLQVNTEEHIKQFSKYVKNFDTSLINNKMDYINVNPDNYFITDIMKFLLYMGVVGYGVKLMNTDKDYCNFILNNLLDERKVSFLIADKLFGYGANKSISAVIINDSIGNKSTINTILQLIGRTGRVGKSEIGQVYIDNNTLTRLINFFSDMDINNDEGIIIFNSFEKIKKHNLEQEEFIKEKLNKEKIKLELLKEKIEKEKLEQERMEQEKINKIKEQKKIKYEEDNTWSRASNNVKYENNNSYQSISNNSEIVKSNEKDDNDEWRRNNISVKKILNIEPINNTNKLNLEKEVKKDKYELKQIFGLKHGTILTKQQKIFREQFL